MKIAGINFEEPTNIIIPIIRGETEIIFQAACISDYSEFDKVCLEPEPKMILHRGAKQAVPNIDDPGYKKEMEEYSTHRYEWMISKSLLATEGLEWDTIDYSDARTFSNYKTELKANKFSDIQIGQLIQGVLAANGLSEFRITEARERFLASRRDQQA